ncbi:MAG TPA: universal stress protein [Cyclobacteriaceae bacterium]
MKPFRNILLGLDASDLDPLLIKFASFMSRSNPTRAFYFVNIIKHMKVPKEVRKEFPEIVEAALKDRKSHINDSIRENLVMHPDSTSKVIVKNGDPAKEILKLIEQLDIDLIVMGKKPSAESSGVVLHQVARRADCNLLIVPKGGDAVLNDLRTSRKLLVANDYSNHSELAMEHAVNMALNSDTKKTIEIYCQHVYTVPTGYHYTGKTYEEFAEIMRNNAEKSYKKFIKKIDIKGSKIIPVYSLETHGHLVSSIYRMAVEINADVIIFGARGVSSTTAIFIGSFAEKMLKIDSTIPLLVVRTKGDNVGFLEYIRKF